MAISQKVLVLLAASLILASCETTQTVTTPPEVADAAEPAPEVMAPPAKRIVIQSAIVPDDPVPAPVSARKPRAKPAVTASAVRSPVIEDEVASPVTAPPPKPAAIATPDPIVAKPAPAIVAVAPPVPATPAPAPAELSAVAPPDPIAPSDSISVADVPGATTDPVAEPPPSSLFNDPAALLKDPKAFLQAKIGGMPLWLVVLFALLAFMSLVIGFRGRKEPEPVSI